MSPLEAELKPRKLAPGSPLRLVFLCGGSGAELIGLAMALEEICVDSKVRHSVIRVPFNPGSPCALE